MQILVILGKLVALDLGHRLVLIVILAKDAKMQMPVKVLKNVLSELKNARHVIQDVKIHVNSVRVSVKFVRQHVSFGVKKAVKYAKDVIVVLAVKIATLMHVKDVMIVKKSANHLVNIHVTGKIVKNALNFVSVMILVALVKITVK